jgi:hypothetical protein
LNKRTYPYFAVVRCPKYPFAEKQDEVHNGAWFSNQKLFEMTDIFSSKYIYEFQHQRYVSTNPNTLKVPNELKDMRNKQNSHHASL